MSIRVNQIPEADNSYILTNKKILVHDLTTSPNASTKLLDLGRILNSNTGVSDGDKGDIIVSSLGTNWVIKNNVVSLNKLVTLSASTLLGNPTNSTANASQITLGSSLSFTGSTLNVAPNTTVQKVTVQTNDVFVASNSVLNFVQGSNIQLLVYNDFANNRTNIQFDGLANLPVSDGDKGDITVSSLGTIWTVDANAITTSKVLNNAITYAKIQQVGIKKLLGNAQTSAGNVEEISLSPTLDFTSSVLGVVPDSSIQKVNVLLGGALVGSRKAINFNFTNLGFAVTDDNVNNRVNINLTGVSGTSAILKNGTFVGSQSNLNLIEGPNTTITAVNNVGQQRIDVTLTATNPDLQAVTDAGTVTTNNMFVTSPACYIGASSLLQFGEATLGQVDSATGGYLRLGNNDGFGSTIQVSNLTAQRTLELPNGNGVIPLTVNGVGANSSGNIVITVGGGGGGGIQSIVQGTDITVNNIDPLNPIISGIAGWKLTGNAGTSASTNFIGTTDNVNLIFKRNNIFAGIIGADFTVTGFGSGAYANNTTGAANVFLGDRALRNNTTGNLNVAIGGAGLFNNTTGSSNIGIGGAFQNNTTGSANIGIGSQGGNSIATGNSNTIIGVSSFALPIAAATQTASNNIGLGYTAGCYSSNANNQLFINSIDRINTTGDKTLSIIYGQQTSSIATQLLTINGQLKINNGAQAAGYVFTSDANGVGTWAAPTGGGGGGNVVDTLQATLTAGTTLTSSHSIFAGTNTISFDGSAIPLKAVSSANTAFEATSENSPNGSAISARSIYPVGFNNIQVNALKLIAGISGGSANGHGVGISFDAASTLFNRNIGSYGIRYSNNVDANISAYEELNLVNNDVIQVVRQTLSTGQLKLNKYGINTFAGTAVYGLGVNASGEVVEIALGGGGSTIYTGTAPINVLGSVISVSDATATTSGVLTAGPSVQEIGGPKRFIEYVIADNRVKIWKGANRSSNSNVGIGDLDILGALTTGNGNAAFGMFSMFTASTGSFNAAFGSGSLFRLTTGQRNAFHGTDAGSFITTGSENTGIGDQVLNSITTGNNNTAIGKNAGTGSNVSGCVFIGHNSGVGTIANNELHIGNGTGGGTDLIYGKFTDRLIRVNGLFQVSSLTTSAAPPAITGQIYPVISDQEGQVSFDTRETVRDFIFETTTNANGIDVVATNFTLDLASVTRYEVQALAINATGPSEGSYDGKKSRTFHVSSAGTLSSGTERVIEANQNLGAIATGANFQIVTTGTNVEIKVYATTEFLYWKVYVKIYTKAALL